MRVIDTVKRWLQPAGSPMVASDVVIGEGEIAKWAEHFKREILREYPKAQPGFRLVENQMDRAVTMGPSLTAEVEIFWDGEKKVIQFMPEVPECWDPVLSQCLDWLDEHAARTASRVR